MNNLPNRRMGQQKPKRSVTMFEMVLIYVFVYGGLALIGTLILAKLGEWAWDAVKTLITVVRG